MNIDQMTTADADRRSATKQRLRVGLIVPLMVVAVLALAVAGSIFASVTRSEQTEDIFTDAAELPPELIDEVTWLADPLDLPRPMEPLTRVDVTASWLRAWEQLTIVSETGDTSGVETYFSGPARGAVLDRAGEWRDRTVKQLGHTLQMNFYSADGQIIGLSAVESRIERTMDTPDGPVVRVSNESYDVVIVLDDGNWRIHHLVRTSYDPGAWTLTRP